VAELLRRAEQTDKAERAPLDIPAELARRETRLAAIAAAKAEIERRARLAAKRDQLRARNRLSKFLLRQGRHAPAGTTVWTGKYLNWVRQQHFEHAAQEATLLD
jgi:hypothetical protein